MGRRPRLLLCALLGFLLPGPPAESVHHTYENFKLMQIAVHPTMTVQISSEGPGNLKAQEAPSSIEVEATNEEEKTLNNLVGLLQDMVKNIPTEQAQTPQPTEQARIMVSNIEPSPSETVDTVWVNMKPKMDGIEPSQTVAMTRTVTPTTTTAFWKLRSDSSASVVLHTDKAISEKNTPENLEIETSASIVLFSDKTTPEKSLVSVSLLMETDTTKQKAKTFDQLTNGALASLVESLKNVKKLHVTLHNGSNTPQQERNDEKAVEPHQQKPVSADILDLIDTLIKTVKNAPSSVKEDPALHIYIEKAESYLKNALELAGEAERRLEQDKKLEEEKKVNVVIPPLEHEKVNVMVPPLEHEVTVEIPSLEQERLEEEKKVEVVLPPLKHETVKVAIPPLEEREEEKKVEVVLPPLKHETVKVAIPPLEEREEEEKKMEVVLPPLKNEIVKVEIPHLKEEKKVEVVLPSLKNEIVKVAIPPLEEREEEEEKKVEVVLPPLPSGTVPVSAVTIQLPPSPPEPLAKKAENAQVEMGKLKAFINLLYGFSPHLTAYAENSPNKKAAEDIIDRAMAVLDAIKSIFCGNPEGRSKLMLQQLLKEDMELVRQAMKERRVS
ncbi:FK506-binding protein 5-like [Rhineura floridana]|uniref:FK506-binding protein 5-like n=1 Tax=Rhineura floridana TaxID=261503 RepID=UPI002AC886F8|nr:FK506-binding protein 5-like [Rhineura floridana]